MLPPPPTSTLFPYTTLFRSVLALGEPTSRLARSAALRQHVDGGPGDAAVPDRVGVDGNEHIRLRSPRAPDPIAQHEKLIPVARQHRRHSRLRIDALGERARDREHDVLLARAAATDRTRI